MRTLFLAIPVIVSAAVPVEAAQWSLLPTTGGPAPGRTGHTAIFDPQTRAMVVYGGFSGFDRGDIWRLTNADGSGPSAWSQILAGGTAPAARAGHSAVYDVAGDSMVVFAGEVCRDDTWLLSNPFGGGTGPTEWRPVASQSRPPARNQHTAVIDTASRRVIVFGGVNNCPSILLRNDVWVLSDLDTNAPKWTQLFPSGTPPNPRWGHSAVYDPVSNRMIVFGGYSDNFGGFLNDAWALSNANGLGGAPVWTKLNPSGPTPAPRDNISAVYDPASDEMTIAGGLGSTVFDDVWVLRNTRTTPAWSQLAIQGPTPGAPTGYSLVYSPALRTSILYGGIPGMGGGYSASTWTLAGGSPAAETAIFANFDAGYTVDNSGWRLGGGAMDGDAGTTVGILIVPTATGTLSRLELVVSREAGAGRLNAYLMGDNSGPSGIIEAFSIPVTSAAPTLVQVNSASHPLLVSGQRYWLVLTVPDLINDSIFWHRRTGQPATTVANRRGQTPVFSIYGAFGAMARLIGQPASAGSLPMLLAPQNLLTGARLDVSLSWAAAPGAVSYDVYFGTTNPPPFQANTTNLSFSPGVLAANSTYYWSVVARISSGNLASGVWQFTTGTGTAANGLMFTPVAPCRVVDTRAGQGTAGAFGPPSLAGGEIRSFPIPQGRCGIPSSAQAYSVNVTVVPGGPLGYLTIWPTGQPQPFVSTLNSFDGGVVANSAIVPAGSGGAVSVFVTGPSDVVLDINGYFDASGPASALAFYPATPCRIADTRNPTGPLGGPVMSAGQSRSFPVVSSPCGVPSSARAYSLNVTAVPSGPLSYLTLWPSGQPQPFVSTLNSPAGRIVANAALAPAGNNGDVSVFVTSTTDVILDINGYFAPPGNPGAMLFYPVTPCRIMDTRNPDATFGGPIAPAGSTRLVPVPSRGCGTPPGAKAYSVNVTVVPDGPLGFLTAWPAGAPQPFVSTLNSDGRVVANAAIVPANDNGAIAIFVTNPAHIIVDVNGYFAPLNTPLPPPVQVSPADGAVFNIYPRTIVYTWNPVPGATRYGLQIEYCQPGRTQCLPWYSTTTAATSVTNGFVGAQPGRWRVWAINDATGQTSAVTGWWWFDSLI